MFNRADEVKTFIDYLEDFVRAVINHKMESHPQDAVILNRKREALETCILEQCGLFPVDEPETNLEDEFKCPECGSEMKERKNSQTQQKFYGCTKYPKCRGTRDEFGLSKYDREEQKNKVEQQEGFSFNKAKRDPVTEVTPPIQEKHSFNPFAKK